MVITFLLTNLLRLYIKKIYMNNLFFLQGRSSRENKVVGKLNNNTPAVPPVVKENELLSFRKSLPIYELREQILKLVSDNQVS